MEEELRKISERLERIERLGLLGCKTVLDLDEAAQFAGYSKAYLYRLTSQRAIPHYKKNRKLYFRKSELEEWLLSDRVRTGREIRSMAATYCVTGRMPRRERREARA